MKTTAAAMTVKLTLLAVTLLGCAAATVAGPWWVAAVLGCCVFAQAVDVCK